MMVRRLRTSQKVKSESGQNLWLPNRPLLLFLTETIITLVGKTIRSIDALWL
jgi:hypothetical protein